MLDGALYDRFYTPSEINSVDYGAFDWYASNKYQNNIPIFEPFPDGMVLITKDRDYEFDVRSMGSKFHIISEKFIEVAQLAEISFDSFKRIEVLDQQGISACSNAYYAARFLYRNQSELVDSERSTLFGKEGVLKIKRLTIDADCSEPAFRLTDLYPSYDGIFCSEHFLQCALDLGGLRGASFEDIETANWPSLRIA